MQVSASRKANDYLRASPLQYHVPIHVVRAMHEIAAAETLIAPGWLRPYRVTYHVDTDKRQTSSLH